MLEIEDTNLGQVKVVNVTEARSSIAAIMNDQKFNYIITKNNRPIRVIINYDHYQKTRDRVVVKPVKQSRFEKGDPKSQENRKMVESPSKLQGLLKERAEDLKRQQDEDKQVEEQKLAVGAEDVSDVISEKPRFPKSNLELMDTMDEESVELEEEQDFHEELTPLATQSLEDASKHETGEVLKSFPEASALDFEGDFFTQVSDLPEDDLLVAPEAPLTSSESLPALSVEIDPEPLTHQSESLVSHIEEPISPSFTPEEQDYFNRFRKLYETAPKDSKAPLSEMTLSSSKPLESGVQKKMETRKESFKKDGDVPSIEDLLKELDNE